MHCGASDALWGPGMHCGPWDALWTVFRLKSEHKTGRCPAFKGDRHDWKVWTGMQKGSMDRERQAVCCKAALEACFEHQDFALLQRNMGLVKLPVRQPFHVKRQILFAIPRSHISIRSPPPYDIHTLRASMRRSDMDQAVKLATSHAEEARDQAQGLRIFMKLPAHENTGYISVHTKLAAASGEICRSVRTKLAAASGEICRSVRTKTAAALGEVCRSVHTKPAAALGEVRRSFATGMGRIPACCLASVPVCLPSMLGVPAPLP
eukprot:356594-Chlamydomonas_euryale.AAC.2